MIKFRFAGLLFLFTLLFSGCGKEKKSVEVQEIDISDLQEITVADSMEASDTAKPKVELKDSIEAEQYLKDLDDSDRYTVGILPRMAKECPEYLEKLINSDQNGFIIVDKGRMKVALYDRYGCLVKEYGMACSKKYGTKHKKADNRTPEGFFSVEGVYNSTDWLFTDDNGVTSKKKGQFGPRFIRLKIPNTSQIGIHGTCAPWSIGGRSSHGCIRLTNENILDLVERVEKGMPVIVVPGSKDMKVNKEEGYDIPWVASVPNQKRPNTGNHKEPTEEEKEKALDELERFKSEEVAGDSVGEIHSDTLPEESHSLPVDSISE